MSETHQPDDRLKVRRYVPQSPSGADPRFPSPLAFPPPEASPPPEACVPSVEPAAPSGARPRFEQPAGLRQRLALWTQRTIDRILATGEQWQEGERRLNWRLMIASIVVLGVVAVGLPLWRRHQLTRQGGAFLARATYHEQQQDWARAADYCWRYISLTGDRGACLRAAANFEKSDTSALGKQRAIELYLLAVAYQDNVAARQRLAELAFELGNDRLVLEQIDRWTALAPQETAERARLMALAKYRMARLGIGAVTWGDAAGALESYLRMDRTSDLLSLLLADLYRRDLRDVPADECDQAADLVMNRLVEADEQRASSWLARHAYRVRYELVGAEDDLARAQKLAPDDVATLTAAAQWALRQGDFTGAAGQFERLAAQTANQAAVYLGWGEALTRAGQPDRAIDVWTAAASKPLDGLPALLLRLAEAQLERRQTQTAEEILSRVDLALETLPAETSARDAALWRVGLSSAQARLRLSQGEFAVARDLWQQLVNSADAARLPEAVEQRGEWLAGIAECQVRLGQLEQALSLFKEVAVLKPDDPSQALRAALAYERAGQMEQARDWFLHATALEGDRSIGRLSDGTSATFRQSDGWAGLARVELAQQGQVPPAQRRWDEFHRYVRNVRLHHGDPVAIRLLWAQHLNLSDKKPQALSFLEKSFEEHPESEPTGRGWLLAADQWGTAAESEHAWRRYVKAFGPTAWSRQIEARRLVKEGHVNQALSCLWTAAREAPSEDREALVRSAASLAARHLGLDRAIAAVEEFAVESGTLETWRLVGELCLEGGDYERLQQIEPRLEAREGQAGTLWRYFRAQRLLATSPPEDQAAMLEIDRLSRDIEDVAASWPPGVHLRAQVARRRGRIEQAIPLYELALRGGQRSPVLWQELITSLYESGRIELANDYLEQLEADSRLPESLGTVAVDVYVRQGQLARALELAKAELARRPNDLAAHLWHAQTLYLSGQVNEALAAHFQALAAFPADERCWSSLHNLLLEAGRRDLDEQLLQQADTADELLPDWRLWFAARGRGDLGQWYESAMRWRRLAKSFPNHLAGLRGAGEFFAIRDPATAIAAWRRAIELAPDDRSTRRVLAAALASQAADDGWQEIEALLTRFPNGATPEIDDQRLWAELLLKRGRQGDVELARRQLEAVVEQHRNTQPSDHWSLARTCSELKDEPAAHQALSRLLNREPQHEQGLAEKAKVELQFGALRDAETTLQALESAHPTSPLLPGLTASLYEKQGRPTEFVDWFGALLDKPAWQVIANQQRAKACVAAAEALTALNNLAGAEAQFRAAIELDAASAVALCGWLLKQSRSTEALDVCLTAAEQGCLPAGVKLAALVAALDDVDERTIARVQATLEKLVAPPCQDVALLVSAADVLSRRGDGKRAAQLCRRALAVGDGDVTATVGLAWAVADASEGRPEAEAAIERAMTVFGRRAELCDALGVLRLAEDRANDAATLFQEANRLTDANPTADKAQPARCALHLAAALAKLGQPEAADEQFARATRLGLRRTLLRPLEASWFDALGADGSP